MSGDSSKQPQRGDITPEEREALRRRSAEIGERLNEAQRQRESGQRPVSRRNGAGGAVRASAELIGGIVVGSAIGWYLDKWLGNKQPVLFVLFFLLGAGAGILNVVRAGMREKTPPAPSVKDDDEDR